MNHMTILQSARHAVFCLFFHEYSHKSRKIFTFCRDRTDFFFVVIKTLFLPTIYVHKTHTQKSVNENACSL